MALTTITTTSTFEPIAWTACAYFLTRGIVKRDDGALFWAAIVAGIATETKYGVAIWPLGLALGLLLTEARAILAQRSYPASYPVLAISQPHLISSARAKPFTLRFLVVDRHGQVANRLLSRRERR